MSSSVVCLGIVVLLAGGLLSPAVAQVSGVTLREQLVMDYLRHCVDANPRGGDCVEVAERWFRDGPDAFGRRVAWLQAASIYRGLIMAADDDDAALHATATERAAQIYRAVLDGFPADFAALSGLAWMQPSRTERLAALQDYLRVHPDDETVWYIVSMMLARGRETAPPRSALDAARHAWDIAAGTRDGVKYDFANRYLHYVAILDGDRAAESERARIRESCGGPAALAAISNLTDAPLADRLGALRDAAELYCDGAYRRFDIDTCAALRQESAQLSESNPDSFAALFLMVRIAEAEAGLALSTTWDPSNEPPGLRSLYGHLLELRPDSPKARWRIARLIANSDQRRATMKAVAESAGRPESELADSLFSGRRFFVEDQDLADRAVDAGDPLLARARAKLAKGFPDYQFNFGLPATVPQGPSCAPMADPHVATNTPR